MDSRFVLVASVSLLAACGGDAVEPVAESRTRPPSQTTFVSVRYGYRLTLPSGWRKQPTPGAWSGVLYPGDPGVDTLVDESATRRVFIAARRLEPRVGAAAWAATVANHVPSLCSATERSSGFVADTRAELRVYDCSDGYVAINATLVRSGRGFAFGWVSPRSGSGATAADRLSFQRVLRSVRFTETDTRGGSG